MKFKEFILNEAKVENVDKIFLKNIIKKPPKKQITYTLKSFAKDYADDFDREMEIYKDGKNLVLSYNKDFYELTAELANIVDNIGYKFKVSNSPVFNTTYFEVDIT